MSVFKRLRNLFRSDDLSSDIEREMAFHLDERVDDLVAGGMRTEAARREARRRFGNYGRQKERTRERDIFSFLDTLIADIRYAARALRAAPAFALVAILSLGLGIGANTAIFTLINTVLLKTLPVSHPEELVLVTRDKSTVFTNPLWEAIRDRQDVFGAAASYATTAFNLANGGETRRVNGSLVSGEFFPMLGVQPVLGRLIARTDDSRGCPAVAVISASFWENEYGGRDNVLGKIVSLNGKPFPIVGVVDPRFFGPEIGRISHVYAPLCSDAFMRGSSSRLDSRSSWFLRILARPKPALPPAQIATRLATFSPTIAEATLPSDWPAEATKRYLSAKLGTEAGATGFSGLRAQYSKALWVLMAVVSLVLLIACANVANLLLARAAAREREVAVRLALGAGRGRIVRQLLTESVFLSLLGAAAGVAFATWGTRVLVGMMSTTSRAVSLDLSVDGVVLGFTILVAIATGILFGLAPAWRARRVDPHTAMKSHGRGLAEGHSRFGIGKMLVVAQVALSLVLIAGAGLLLGSWRRLATLDPGFHSGGLVMIGVDIARTDMDSAQRAILFPQIRKRLAAIPGVSAVSAASITPVGPASWNNVIKVDGHAPASTDDALVWMNEVTDGYFSTLGTPVVAGRDFGAGDLPSSPKVAIVTEALARKFFKGGSAVGRQFSVQEGPRYTAPYEIVGVVKDSKYGSMREEPQPIAFFPASQTAAPGTSTNYIVRVEGDVGLTVPAIRSVFREMAPRAALELGTLDRQISESLQLPRTLATLSGFFGALALLLATIGLYGIMSYSVARRRNEIGVRIALGAAYGRVVRMVLGEVGRMVIAGVVLGTLLALAAMKLVTAFLYGVKPSDPTTLVASALTLLTVGLGAAMLPARRAARLDPVEALRED